MHDRHERELTGIRTECPCLNVGCKRHGYCGECRVFNESRGKTPGCMREKEGTGARYPF